MPEKTIERDAKGIPLKSPNPDGVPVAVFYTIMNTVFGAIGFAVAWFLAYTSSKQESADSRMDIVAQYDLGWLYLGILVLRFLQIPLFIFVGQTRGAAKIHVPDQHVYKVMGAEGSKLGYVLMDTDGANGDFNRAQRAWQNYCENISTLLALYVAASWAFPYQAFICATIWAVARVMSASGYKSSADGRVGGMLLQAIAMNVLQGMVMIVAIKTLL